MIPVPRRTRTILFSMTAIVLCSYLGSGAAQRPAVTVPALDRRKIEAALPATAFVRPAKPRRLLIFDRNVGYPGHASIAHANLAFTLMGTKTGAYETVVSRDPQVFAAASLKRFDAVFFNNTVGNCFEDSQLRHNLIAFVYAGGGLFGVHGATVAFTRWPGAHEDWPEFGIMLGGRGARHRESNELVTVKVECPDHPLTKSFGTASFEYRDEFFRVHDPYSRDRVRVLLSIDTDKTDLRPRSPRFTQERADNDYALAWVRNYGRGRVFYSTIAHNPYVFWDPMMLKLYLAGLQFVLGDLPAPTTPSSKLSPAVRAQEKLGWRLGVTAYSFHKYTFFEAIEKTARLGLSYIGGLSFQKISKDIPKNLEPGLTAEELKRIRLKLDAAGVRLITYYIHRIPADPAGCRKIFEFGRALGIETFISEPLPEALDTIERFTGEYGIACAIHNHGKKTSPHSWNPEGLARLCKGRSPLIGACGDLGYWIRSGIDPIEAVKTLGSRLLTVQMHDLNERSAEGHDVPWGTGVGQTDRFLRELHRLGVRPTLIGLEYSYDWFDSMPEMAQSIEFFNTTIRKVGSALRTPPATQAASPPAP